MTPHEYQQCILRVRALWGDSGRWDKAEHLYRNNPRLKRVSQAAFLTAISHYENEGQEWPPSVPQVLTRAAGGRSQTVARIEKDMCGHPTIASVSNTVTVCAHCLEEWQTGAGNDADE